MQTWPAQFGENTFFLLATAPSRQQLFPATPQNAQVLLTSRPQKAPKEEAGLLQPRWSQDNNEQSSSGRGIVFYKAN